MLDQRKLDEEFQDYIRKGNISEIRRMLSSGEVDPRRRVWYDHLTPQELAAKLGNIEVLQLLIEYGFDMNFSNSLPPLIAAIYAKQNLVIKFLLEIGVNVNEPDDGGATAIHAAAAKGNLEVIKKLVELGADPNFAYDDQVDHPLLHAAYNKDREMFNYLYPLTDPAYYPAALSILETGSPPIPDPEE